MIRENIMDERWLKEFQQKLGALQRIGKEVKRWQRYRKDEKSLFLLEESLNKIQRYQKKASGLEALILELGEFCNKEREDIDILKQRFKGKLGSELAARLPGIEVYGNLPELKVGLFTLEFLLSRGEVKVWYGPKVEFICKRSLAKTDLAKFIKDAYETLEKSGLKGDTFLNLLWRSYEGLSTSLGSAVPLSKVLQQMAWLQQKKAFLIDPKKENFKGYGRVQFSYDLFRTSKRTYNDYEFRLIVATREQTKDKKDFLWVPTSRQGEGGYFSALSFKRI